MNLTEWEVWLTYSMYLSGEVRDLHQAAGALIESGLADVTVVSDGFAAFRGESELETGRLDLEMTPDHRQGRFTLPEGASGFVAEGLFQSAIMRFSERRLFAEENAIIPPYLRAQLSECWAHSSEARTCFYPSIKLFENGVVLVSFRMLSPEDAVAVPAFIDGFVNGYTRSFERLETGVGLAGLVPRAVLMSEDLGFGTRVAVNRAIRRLQAEAKERARTSSCGDFEFELADLEPGFLAPRSINEFAHLVAGAVAHAVSGTREGVSYLLRGAGSVLRVEGPWVGRPHVHLLKFDDQQNTAAENEERHGDSLGWIMARHAGSEPDRGRTYLPKSLRLFDDYGAYVNEALTLWVQSKRSIQRSMQAPGDQRPLAEVVLEHQATAEMLDYGYMVHRRFAHRAATITASTEQVLAAQRDLVRLEAAMGEVGRSGEIRGLLESAWKRMGVRRLREAAGQALVVRQAESSNLEARRVQRWGSALAVVLGVGVVPALANDIVAPVWKWLEWSTPGDPSSEKVVFLGLAVVTVAVLLWGLGRWTSR